eukprot:TRINITY_DN12105_c0_g1_i2.p1 TRINITY_DN12105_c0_g1~~TRINITY_DN12105_c0_g1_i2.p1  ORF type:complete len:161 (+),score=24.40 TRINITY_DN12105_c0_g1_i2:385-867(+)
MTLDLSLNGKRGRVLGFVTKVFVWVNGESHAFDSHNIGILEPSATQPELASGSRVKVVNLAINTDLNGQVGTVKGTQQTAFVAIEDLGIRCFQITDLEPLSSSDTITKGTTVKIKRLLLEPELNGKTAVVRSIGAKVIVQLPSPHGIVSLPPMSLSQVNT